MNSLRQVQLTLDYVESLGHEIKWHGRVEGEAAHYCNVCEVSNKMTSQILNICSSLEFFRKLYYPLFVYSLTL